MHQPDGLFYDKSHSVQCHYKTVKNPHNGQGMGTLCEFQV